MAFCHLVSCFLFSKIWPLLRISVFAVLTFRLLSILFPLRGREASGRFPSFWLYLAALAIAGGIEYEVYFLSGDNYKEQLSAVRKR